MHQIRDDVDSEYDKEEIAKIYEQIEIEGIGYDHFEGLFHTGQLDCAIYGFEKALMFHFPTDTFSGLFVSVVLKTDLDIDAVIDECKSAIRRHK
jgi:hypothetical protein